MTPTGKLIDQLNELKATKETRAALREAQRIRQEQEHKLWIVRAGAEQAAASFDSIKEQIIRVAERNDATEYEIPVQTTARDYSMDEYDAAYAEKLADLLRTEGLGVEWVRTTQEPGNGSYYQFSEVRYNTTLKVTW